MGPVGVILIVVAVLLLGGVVAMLVMTMPIAKKVYETQLVRTTPEKWGRVCSCPENEEQQAMWDAGVAWAEPHKDKMTEVRVENDGFKLVGEYYNFGHDRCAIILPGRCECLIYSYYFAEPYEKAGFNVLVVDTRCHGESEGVYNTIGVKESGDVLAWAKLAHDELGNREVWIHGICIGTSSGLFALTSPKRPAYLKGLVTEGCYVSLRETFKRHMIADNRPLFPVLDEVMYLVNKYTGTNVYTQKPIRVIKKVPADCRMLFLYGEQDIFSIPAKSRKLFAACPVADKKIVWFPKGGHSHLRINNVETYDRAIYDFFN